MLAWVLAVGVAAAQGYPPDQEPAEVLPTSAVREPDEVLPAPDAQLPRTGASTLELLALGGGVIVVGGGMVVFARIRGRRQAG